MDVPRPEEQSRGTGPLIDLVPVTVRSENHAVAVPTLGGAVTAVRMVRIGLPDGFVSRVGDQADLVRHHGITDTAILAAANDLLDIAARRPSRRPLNGGEHHDNDLSRV